MKYIDEDLKKEFRQKKNKNATIYLLAFVVVLCIVAIFSIINSSKYFEENIIQINTTNTNEEKENTILSGIALLENYDNLEDNSLRKIRQAYSEKLHVIYGNLKIPNFSYHICINDNYMLDINKENFFYLDKIENLNNKPIKLYFFDSNYKIYSIELSVIDNNMNNELFSNQNEISGTVDINDWHFAYPSAYNQMYGYLKINNDISLYISSKDAEDRILLESLFNQIAKNISYTKIENKFSGIKFDEKELSLNDNIYINLNSDLFNITDWSYNDTIYNHISFEAITDDTIINSFSISELPEEYTIETALNNLNVDIDSSKSFNYKNLNIIYVKVENIILLLFEADSKVYIIKINQININDINNEKLINELNNILIIK